MNAFKDIPDIEVVNLAQLGDETAKQELIDRCKNFASYQVHKYAKLNYQLNYQDIEDLTSECYVIILENLNLYNETKGGFPNFINHSIRNRILNFLRDRKLEYGIIDYGGAEIETLKVPQEEKVDIRERLNTKKLTEREKEIIALILSGESQVDIAKRYKVTKSMIGKILRKCVK